jgi:hypothetical protein
VKSDAKRRHAPRTFDRIGHGWSGHHQAGSGYNPFAMGAFDRFIDFRRSAEVIGGYDQVLQA